jgi:hypothetical protein
VKGLADGSFGQLAIAIDFSSQRDQVGPKLFGTYSGGGQLFGSWRYRVGQAAICQSPPAKPGVDRVETACGMLASQRRFRFIVLIASVQVYNSETGVGMTIASC